MGAAAISRLGQGFDVLRDILAASAVDTDSEPWSTMRRRAEADAKPGYGVWCGAEVSRLQLTCIHAHDGGVEQHDTSVSTLDSAKLGTKFDTVICFNSSRSTWIVESILADSSHN